MCRSGRIALPGFLPSYERCCGQSWTCCVCSVVMGQPRVASATWHDRNKRISRDSYELVGQQVRQTMASKPMWVCDQTKNSKSRFEMNDKIPSQTDAESVGVSPYGTGVHQHPSYSR